MATLNPIYNQTAFDAKLIRSRAKSNQNQQASSKFNLPETQNPKSASNFAPNFQTQTTPRFGPKMVPAPAPAMSPKFLDDDDLSDFEDFMEFPSSSKSNQNSPKLQQMSGKSTTDSSPKEANAQDRSPCFDIYDFRNDSEDFKQKAQKIGKMFISECTLLNNQADSQKNILEEEKNQANMKKWSDKIKARRESLKTADLTISVPSSGMKDDVFERTRRQFGMAKKFLRLIDQNIQKTNEMYGINSNLGIADRINSGLY